MFRLLIVLALVAAGAAYSLRGPYYILLFYLWIAYFRPEEWLWLNPLGPLELSLTVGVGLLVASLFARERFRFGLSAWLLLLFLLHGLVSSLLSPLEDLALYHWQAFARVVAISYLLSVLVSSEQRLRLTLLVICLSLGFEGARQGWTDLILNPGAVNTNAWPMLGDNNGVAVGMLMLTPVALALAATAGSRTERLLLRVLAVGVIYRAISTYSRGGVLAALGLTIHYIVRTKHKAAGILALALVVAAIIPVLPDAFWDRMGTVPTNVSQLGDVEPSAAGRLHFWRVAVIMADDRPFFGIGLNTFNEQYSRYDPSDDLHGTDRSVHSAWFGILAELGWLGFALFVTIFLRALWTCRRVRRLARREPEFEPLSRYAIALEAQLLVFAIGSSFVIFQYNELLWHTLGLTIALENVLRSKLETAATMAGLRPPADDGTVMAATAPHAAPRRIVVPRAR